MADHCAHCGIPLTKVDPHAVIAELKPRTANHETLEDVLEKRIGRFWCSERCHTWWVKRQGVANATR